MKKIIELVIRILKLSDHTPHYKTELDEFIQALEQDKLDEYLPSEKSIWFPIKTQILFLLQQDAQNRDGLIAYLRNLKESVAKYSILPKSPLGQVSERLKKYFDNQKLGLIKTQKQIINAIANSKIDALELHIRICNEILIDAQKPIFIEEFPDLALYIKFYNEVLNAEQRTKFNTLYQKHLQKGNTNRVNLTEYLNAISALLSPEQQAIFASEEYYKNLVALSEKLNASPECVYVSVSLLEVGLWKDTFDLLLDEIVNQKRVATTLKKVLNTWRESLATASNSGASSSSSSSFSTRPESTGHFPHRILHDDDSMPGTAKKPGVAARVNAHLRSSSDDDGATSLDDDKGHKPAAVLVSVPSLSADREPSPVSTDPIPESLNRSGSNGITGLDSIGLDSSSSSAPNTAASASATSSADLATTMAVVAPATSVVPAVGGKRTFTGTDGPSLSMTPGRSRDTLFQLRQRVQALQKNNAAAVQAIEQKRRLNTESAQGNQQKRERLEQEEQRLQTELEALQRKNQELQQQEHQEDDRGKEIAAESQRLDEDLAAITSTGPTLS